MERYNYYEAVKADVTEYIERNIDLTEWAGNREGLEESLNEDLWSDDSVTGNASGSYTFNTWKAEENLAHNWEEIEETPRSSDWSPKFPTAMSTEPSGGTFPFGAATLPEPSRKCWTIWKRPGRLTFRKRKNWKPQNKHTILPQRMTAGNGGPDHYRRRAYPKTGQGKGNRYGNL